MNRESLVWVLTLAAGLGAGWWLRGTSAYPPGMGQPVRTTEIALPPTADLRRMHIDLELQQTPFSTALVQIHRQSGLNLLVFPDVVMQGMDLQRPLTMSLKNITLHEALVCLCDAVSAGQTTPLQFHVEENIIMFHMGQRSADLPDEMRIYDVHEMLATDVQRFCEMVRNAPEGKTPLLAAVALERANMELSGYIRGTIGPRQVYMMAGRIVVLATPEQHARIEKMLDLLKRAPL